MSIYSTANVDVPASLMPVKPSSHTNRRFHIKEKKNCFEFFFFSPSIILTLNNLFIQDYKRGHLIKIPLICLVLSGILR